MWLLIVTGIHRIQAQISHHFLDIIVHPRGKLFEIQTNLAPKNEQNNLRSIFCSLLSKAHDLWTTPLRRHCCRWRRSRILSRDSWMRFGWVEIGLGWLGWIVWGFFVENIFRQKTKTSQQKRSVESCQVSSTAGGPRADPYRFMGPLLNGLINQWVTGVISPLHPKGAQ